jgi:hypothetical protein
MPTKEWFNENPKISAYISKELHQELEAWMIENRVKKVSQGITKILESFLGVGQKELPVNQKFATVEQIELLQKRIEALENKKTRVAQSKPKPEQKSLAIEEPRKEVPKGATGSSVKDSEWLTTKEAYSLQDRRMPLSTFSKLKAKELREKFNLEAKDHKKTVGGPPSRWIRKPFLSSPSHP